MPKGDARIHLGSRESAERYLFTYAGDDRAVYALLLLAELYGSVVIPHWQDLDDAWGAHTELTVQCVEKREWNILAKRVPHW